VLATGGKPNCLGLGEDPNGRVGKLLFSYEDCGLLVVIRGGRYAMEGEVDVICWYLYWTCGLVGETDGRVVLL
jgi:hypothetical protein